jgi:hypothetical protein
LTNILGFNEIQSQLSLGYQFSFAGNISGAVSQARKADNALEGTILSTFHTGQELTSLSQNRSLTLDNDTRQILMAGAADKFDWHVRIKHIRDFILLFCYYIITLGTYVTIVGSLLLDITLAM